MIRSRTVAYIGGAVVLAAWLASAASTAFTPVDPQPPVRPVATAGTDRLAGDVQAQSARLRQRLASAPIPHEPVRNPFTFGTREGPRAGVASAHAVIDPAPQPAPIPSEPELSLIGVAEQHSDSGLVRTAVITGAGDEVYMVTAGQALTARYTVVVIGADAVELKDSITGLTRRLALR